MSTFNELNITCPDCGEEYKGVVWTAVHAAHDPELKDILLGGELNLLMCPQCSHVAYQDHFVLYQDPAAEVVAYIYPLSQQNDEEFLRATTLANYKEAQAVYKPQDRKDYDPLLVFGLKTFVDMMQAEEARAEQSQVAEALCKENEIPYVLLRPSEARRLRTMRVLPTAKVSAKPSRADVLAGLEKLLTINPTLDLYSKLCTRIQDDLEWKIR
jgi:hypothetical protein